MLQTNVSYSSTSQAFMQSTECFCPSAYECSFYISTHRASSINVTRPHVILMLLLFSVSSQNGGISMASVVTATSKKMKRQSSSRRGNRKGEPRDVSTP